VLTTSRLALTELQAIKQAQINQQKKERDRLFTKQSGKRVWNLDEVLAAREEHVIQGRLQEGSLNTKKTLQANKKATLSKIVVLKLPKRDN